MSGKRTLIDIDPDYEDVTDQQNKRQRVLEKDAKQAAVKKIQGIVRTQFGIELQDKEHEVNFVDQRLCEARLMMDRLRACIVANYYGSAGQQRYALKPTAAQSTIHPAVKSHLGKTVKGIPVSHTQTSSEVEVAETTQIGSLSILQQTPVTSVPESSVTTASTTTTTTSSSSTLNELRDSRFKIKKRIIVGNVTKYIPVEKREANDQSTHKWMVYVRGTKESPGIGGFVKKIWFFLHPSYRPNDLVEICQAPFHLTRRGWGEFPIRIQIHFTDSRNKKVDIIHHLKLDRTYTGLQTLGAETVVDVELERECYQPTTNISSYYSSLNTTTISSSDIKTEQSLQENGMPILQNGTDSNSDVNHTIIHSPIKQKTIKTEPGLNCPSPTQPTEPVNGNDKESQPKVTLDMKLLSANSLIKISPTPVSAISSNKQPATSSKQPQPQTIYLKCKDSKGNILLVPKIVVNSKNSANSQPNMTSFRVTSPPSSTAASPSSVHCTNTTNTIRTVVQSSTKSLLGQQTSQTTGKTPVKVNVSNPPIQRPSVQLMVTSKGLQVLPQSQIPPSAANTNKSQKTQSLLTFNTNHTNSSKPVSLLLNSVNYSSAGPPKLQLSIDGFNKNSIVSNKPKVSTVPILIQNKNQKSLLGNSIQNHNLNNLPKPAPTKPSPSVMLASVGSKTFLLQVQPDSPLHQSKLVSQSTQLQANLTNHTINKVQLNNIQNKTVKQQLQEKKKQQSILNNLNLNYKMEPEKRTHVWKKKVKIEEEIIEPIRLRDHEDILSLIKAAVKRHPLVEAGIDRLTHPYCAHSHQQWLNWNVGKRRASEWQRASWVRKFIVDNLKGATVFKGKQLWSIKQIMYWCRLHAFSPHYMESSEEKPSIETNIETVNRTELVNSLTDVNQIIQQLPQQPSTSDNSDDEVDILNTAPATKVKVEVKEEERLPGEEVLRLPPSQEALFIQDTCQKIGVKLKPIDLEENVLGSACEEMIFTAMKLFAEDLLRESFSHQQQNRKTDNTICEEDVQQALINTPTTDFLTNAHLGIKTTETFPALR